MDSGAGRGCEGWAWVDITAANGTQTTRIQTVTTLADGVTPTATEAAAAARIRAAFPNDTLILVSKQTGLVIP
jgi:filamentous hemagglutinin